ncbi:MerR family transcriptional regulator [Roseinatronobacter sp. NSM]|uniref:MerR family transcriptional regulator n=1 Tax=Roseinatronobacter sp. NSM TaxID=3457785 RepID=UPI004036398D
MRKAPEAFRTISETAEALDTPAHVLRFWESKFTQVKPVKRAGGRRYYRRADIDLLAGIKELLHEQGMTIRGVQKLLQEKGARHVAALAPVRDALLDDDAPAQSRAETQPDTPAPPTVATDTPETAAHHETAADTPAKQPLAPLAPAAPPAQQTPRAAKSDTPKRTHIRLAHDIRRHAGPAVPDRARAALLLARLDALFQRMAAAAQHDQHDT